MSRNDAIGKLTNLAKQLSSTVENKKSNWNSKSSKWQQKE